MGRVALGSRVLYGWSVKLEIWGFDGFRVWGGRVQGLRVQRFRVEGLGVYHTQTEHGQTTPPHSSFIFEQRQKSLILSWTLRFRPLKTHKA